MTHPIAETASTIDAERGRLRGADHHDSPWRSWGPYLAERAWGSVREDYSADGDAWASFPFEQARSRAYRWNEDGMAGFCDVDQTWCFALALWNGHDEFLKERMFGLTNAQGNHGEDVKERYWFLDGTPSHSWTTWRYHYPQAAFPYEELVSENGRRGRQQTEYEIDDTGVFDEHRYFDVTVDYAKADPTDLCMRITVRNVGPDAADLEVLPTLWFRNTWAWGLPGADPEPRIDCQAHQLVAVHHRIETLTLSGDSAEQSGFVESIACDNETNNRLLYGSTGRSLYPKDGIDDYVVRGAATVRAEAYGTKAALRYRLTIGPGESREIRLRLQAAQNDGSSTSDFDAVMVQRKREADEFYASLHPSGTTDDEMRVVRQAAAGLLWSKQFFHYDVERWLEGDPAGPPPPPGRGVIRNGGWQHLNNADVLLMPDTWEYPWFAAWDLAFHCVVMAYLDPSFAKRQLLLMLREWYMHPNGQLPAYEWNFSDVNPPVHAWAALRVFEISGSNDYDFLERAFHKLLLNFTWWVNREDSDGNNLFSGGFLGLDNIGPFDRSKLTPDEGVLEQSDGTSWMAMYCLDLLDMALTLAMHDDTYEDVATKFFEHFTRIATASKKQGLWDDADGFFYDQLRLPDGQRMPVKVRSLVGLIALCAVSHVDAEHLARLPGFAARLRWFLANKPELTATVVETDADDTLFAVLEPPQLRRLIERMFDESEFFSPHGIRSVSAYHRDNPLTIAISGQTFRVDYEPGESSTGLFGGNSNWRGPVWMPLNALLVESLRRFARHLGAGYTVEVPTGSGHAMTLDGAATELSRRLVSLFVPDDAGRIPAAGSRDWPDGVLLFHEYFHGDTGAGLGASHQTGWTALAAHLILSRR
ncbi:MAG: MGH1-like glycoside hydrolase domain-containing protein [Acidothermaceae bacterium]